MSQTQNHTQLAIADALEDKLRKVNESVTSFRLVEGKQNLRLYLNTTSQLHAAMIKIPMIMKAPRKDVIAGANVAIHWHNIEERIVKHRFANELDCILNACDYGISYAVLEDVGDEVVSIALTSNYETTYHGIVIAPWKPMIGHKFDSVLEERVRIHNKSKQ